ncbi:hypothetical protein HJX59_27145 (plasmid) [Klebsiella pneumoniae]|nr:hypothetical protein HJX59_27145 [Klebsiella pneumoniae]HCC6220418.1 hypothetical protein [Klebsiella pneumoniae]
MKLVNAISLFSTYLLGGGFSYRYCPVWDKALNRLMDNGSLLEVKNGIALFEHDAQLYEVFVGFGAGFFHFGHLVAVNAKTVGESFRRRPSFRSMDKLQRMVHAEISRVEKEKEREIREMMKSLLTS